jgi:hypothetical protein
MLSLNQLPKRDNKIQKDGKKDIWIAGFFCILRLYAANDNDEYCLISKEELIKRASVGFFLNHQTCSIVILIRLPL